MNAKITLENIEKNISDADTEITNIERTPGIVDRLHEEAKMEDVEREITKLSAKAEAELKPLAEEFVSDIKDAATTLTELTRDRWEKHAKYTNAREAASNLIWGARSEIDPKNENFALLKLMEQVSDKETVSEIINRLEAAKKALGWFKGKKKAIIENLLSDKSRQTYLEFDEARADETLAEQQLEKSNQTIPKSFAQRYRALYMQAWDTSRKIRELFGQKNNMRVDAGSGYRTVPQKLYKMINEPFLYRGANYNKSKAEEAKDRAHELIEEIKKMPGMEKLWEIDPNQQQPQTHNLLPE